MRLVRCVDVYQRPDPQVSHISINDAGHIVVLGNLPPLQPGWAPRGVAILLVPR